MRDVIIIVLNIIWCASHRCAEIFRGLIYLNKHKYDLKIDFHRNFVKSLQLEKFTWIT